MGRYPKAARAALLKCIKCNAPAAQTMGECYVCVECGATICTGTSHLQRDDSGQDEHRHQQLADDD